MGRHGAGAEKREGVGVWACDEVQGGDGSVCQLALSWASAAWGFGSLQTKVEIVSGVVEGLCDFPADGAMARFVKDSNGSQLFLPLSPLRLPPSYNSEPLF
jgi:hypothetical protein